MADTHIANINKCNFLHSYCVRPDVQFEGQHENEKALLVLRAHLITLVPWILNSIFLIIIVFAVNFFLPNFLSVSQILVMDVFAIVFIVAYIWFNVIHYAFNVGIVTNETLVDVDFSGVIFKEVSATQMDKVEDVTDKASGYIGAYFDYGDIIVQTAGQEIKVEFKDVPHPGEIVRIINNLAKEAKKNGKY